MKKPLRAFCALLMLAILTGCTMQQRYVTDFFAMDTFMSIEVWAGSAVKAQTAAAAAEQRVAALGTALSRHAAAGALAKLNAANGEMVTLDEDTYAALSAAVAYAEATRGAFDPTTAPLTDLWGIGTDQAAVPAEQAVEEALSHVDYRNIELLGEGRARLHNGAQVDLGAIGKGYATDIAAALRGGRPMLAALGGNLGVYGENPRSKDGTWSIGLADPDNSQQYIMKIKAHNESVVTSGDYERFFEQDGVRYHHIFNPQTGYPAQSSLRAVTVVDPVSARADAMTTALFVMGLQDGLAFCEKENIQAVFITRDREIYATAGLQDRLTLAEGVDYAFIR